MASDRIQQRLVCQTLWDVAVSCRAFLESVWPSWHAERGTSPAILSMWTCSRSSLFLQRVLREDFSVAATWVTGCPHDTDGQPFPAGFYNGHDWQGHSWVVANGFIVDITADQFGLDPVVILPGDDARYQTSADLALPEFKRKREATMEVLWPSWREAGRPSR